MAANSGRNHLTDSVERTNLETDRLRASLKAIDRCGPSEADSVFDWRNCWYPITFRRDLALDRPTAFTLYDEPLVLFVDAEQRLCCLRDRCPHRAARLSDGQMVKGRIECLYHGWQFGAGGQCLRIPQLPDRVDIPAKACVRSYPVVERQGMVWIWAGAPEQADPETIPSSEGLDEAGVTHVDFQMDLPYDQSYLIENVIDVAHIHIAHDGIRGGGNRASAKPLSFDVQESSINGIRSGFKTISPRSEGSSSLNGALVEYIAPNLVRYTSQYRNAELLAGLDLYSMPLGKSRCRLLYRKYSNFTSWQERWKPRWLEHLTQCTILEQDMGVVVGQHAHIERADGRLRDLWLPIKTSDRLVIEYRKWLDRFGRDLPFYRGFTSSKSSADETFSEKAPWDRYSLHTRVCRTCSNVRRNVERARKTLWVLVAALGSLAILSANDLISNSSVALALIGVLAIAGLGRMKARFE